METFENMAQRYYLEIYPNCAENNSAVCMNGVKDQFMHGFAGRPEKKGAGRLFLKVQDIFVGAAGRVSDEQGSVDLGFLMSRNRGTAPADKSAQCGQQADVYLPDMRLSIFNR